MPATTSSRLFCSRRTLGESGAVSHGPYHSHCLDKGEEETQQAHPDENNVSCLNGDIGARPDGDAHVGPGQGRGVINPVSHHGNFLPFLLELLDLGHLMRRQHLRKDFVDTDLKVKEKNGQKINKNMTIPSVGKGQEHSRNLRGILPHPHLSFQVQSLLSAAKPYRLQVTWQVYSPPPSL